MNPEELLKRINDEIKKMAGDGLTRKEFIAAFDHVMKMMVQMKDELSQLNNHHLSQTKTELLQLSDKLSATHKAALDTLTKRTDKALKDQQRGLNFIHDKVRAVKKQPGPKGEKGDEGQPGKDGVEITPEQLRDKLASLEEDDRLDASFIKNLPKAPDSWPIAPMTGSFHQLGDVDVSGLTTGQSIKYDGVKWAPYTPAGASTAVYGENLTTQGPGKTFTLAHTPVAGTVRLFRGGAYQSVANGDYTITGAVITLTTALATGEVLVGDYSY